MARVPVSHLLLCVPQCFARSGPIHCEGDALDIYIILLPNYGDQQRCHSPKNTFVSIISGNRPLEDSESI
jgi:hypothetical protein